MSFFDFPLEKLQSYKPERIEPEDFDTFWQDTLTQTRQYPLNAIFEPCDFGLKNVDVFDATYNGYGGQPIKGWLILPHHRSEKLPCVVEYIGYGGGRSFPFNHLLWSNAGYAHFIMDTRGQGTSGNGGPHGDTPDRDEPSGSGPQTAGFMTRGITAPQTYFYRRVFTDAVRAVEAARSFSEVDASQIAVTGGSQGGGITLAVSGLMPDVQAAMPDVPFLCHYRRATQITNAAPYNEIVAYCKSHRDHINLVFNTLSYFDGVNMAARAKAPAIFSTGLMDDICPPSTVFAAFNHYGGKQKEIRVYEYNQHEGGGLFQTREKMNFLRTLWG